MSADLENGRSNGGNVGSSGVVILAYMASTWTAADSVCFLLQLDFRTPSGFDRTRNVEIGNKNIKLHYLEEAYTTEHWLVRIYRVKKYANRFQEFDDAVKRRVRKTAPKKVLFNAYWAIDCCFWLKEDEIFHMLIREVPSHLKF